MDPVLLLRWLHVIGACVLLGTGAGIAFFMLMAHRSRDAALIAHVAGTVVIADFLFTATAVIAQPLTGLALAYLTGWRLTEGWILASVALYLFAGAFWTPVVFIQIRLRNLARAAAISGAAPGQAYHRLFRIWFVCGFPAFAAMMAIIWLMLARPQIGF